jgi:hypothetical protein
MPMRAFLWQVEKLSRQNRHQCGLENRLSWLLLMKVMEMDIPAQ